MELDNFVQFAIVMVRGCPHITSAAGGGGGGKPNADDCWRGGVEPEKNLLKWVKKWQRCV